MRNMQYHLVLLIFICCIMSLSVSSVNGATGSGGDSNSIIYVSGQHMNVKADNLPFNFVLEEISRQSGIKITYYVPVNDMISADLRDIPLELGLTKLVRNYSHSFVFERQSSDKNEIITALFIYAKNGRDISKVVYRPADNNNSTLQAAEELFQPGFMVDDAGILLHPNIPAEQDPMHSIMAIDPLMRFDSRNSASSLNNQTQNVHESYIPQPESIDTVAQTIF